MENNIELVEPTETTLNCSSCQRGLMHVLHWADVDDPNLSMIIFATCPFCGGQSDNFKSTGLNKTGPIGSDESNNPTMIFNIETLENNTFKFIIKEK